MQSNKTYHFAFKYGLLVLGLFLIAFGIEGFFFPEEANSDAAGAPLDPAGPILIALIGLLLVLVCLVIKDKFAIVELSNQTVIIKKSGEERAVSWLDIISVSQIQFVQPPLYKLKVRDDDETILFNTEPKYLSVGGFTKDLSGMGELIARKKQELGI